MTNYEKFSRFVVVARGYWKNLCQSLYSIMTLQKGLQFISMTISGGVSIMVLIIWISNLKLFCNHHNTLLSIKIMSFISNFSAFAGSVCLLAMFVYVCIEESKISNHWLLVFQFISNICLNILSIASYLTFLIRLNTTFRGSILEISHKVNILIVLFLILYIAAYSYVNCHVIEYDACEEHDGSTKSLMIANLIIVASEIMASIALMLLFNRSLLKLVDSMQSSVLFRNDAHQETLIPVPDYRSDAIGVPIGGSGPILDNQLSLNFTNTSTNRAERSLSDMLSKTYQLNEKQERLMRVVSRTTILATVSVMISVGFHLAFAFTNAWELNLDEWIMRNVECIYYLLQVLCLYLNFAANVTLYHRLCGCCNGICYCVCVAIHKFKRKDKYQS